MTVSSMTDIIINIVRAELLMTDSTDTFDWVYNTTLHDAVPKTVVNLFHSDSRMFATVSE